MAGRILAGANLFAGPHELDRGIEAGAQIFQIVGRSLAERPVQHRVVGVVAGAGDDPRCGRTPGDPVDDLDLARGQTGQVALHVVEEYPEIGQAQAFELGQLGGERSLRVLIEAQEQLVGAEAHAEANPGVATGPGEGAQRFEFGVGIGLAPKAPQIAVRLRGVEVEAVTVGRQRPNHVGPLSPAVGTTEETFDDSEIDAHVPRLTAGVALTM